MSTGTLRAIGIISGTSMDGIDVGLIETDGLAHVKAGPSLTYPYAPALAHELRALIANQNLARKGDHEDLERAVSFAHAAACQQFMREYAIERETVDLIGLHGQTICHRPAEKFTRQLGLAALVAAETGIDTVYRFRHADVAAGGQGAPFAPVYHQALCAKLDGPVMVLNLGGVANVTYADGGTLIAFDTGPASALIDDFVQRRRNVPFDKDGALAASGAADEPLVRLLMSDPYFKKPAPKSLDRNDFHASAKAVDRLGDADGAATLTAFTVQSIAAALDHVPGVPKRWLVCGGGRHNAAIMAALAARLGCPVEPVEVIGHDGDGLEAQLFGYLAVRSVKGLPLSFSGTTGVPAPLTGGDLIRAPRGD
jgi:anhydro-N-acetylmuramic acid kinase